MAIFMSALLAFRQDIKLPTLGFKNRYNVVCICHPKQCCRFATGGCFAKKTFSFNPQAVTQA